MVSAQQISEAIMRYSGQTIMEYNFFRNYYCYLVRMLDEKGDKEYWVIHIKFLADMDAGDMEVFRFKKEEDARDKYFSIIRSLCKRGIECD